MSTPAELACLNTATGKLNQFNGDMVALNAKLAELQKCQENYKKENDRNFWNKCRCALVQCEDRVAACDKKLASVPPCPKKMTFSTETQGIFYKKTLDTEAFGVPYTPKYPTSTKCAYLPNPGTDTLPSYDFNYYDRFFNNTYDGLKKLYDQVPTNPKFAEECKKFNSPSYNADAKVITNQNTYYSYSKVIAGIPTAIFYIQSAISNLEKRIQVCQEATTAGGNCLDDLITCEDAEKKCLADYKAICP